MRAQLILIALLAGCHPCGEPAPARPDLPPAPALAGSDAPPADPWAATPATSSDDPPSLAERHELADTACPTVTAPYFYRVEKDGKTSHILGTRHVSVGLAKFPKPVHDAIASASLAVLEVAPDHDSDVKQKPVSLPEALGPDLWKRYRTLVGANTADGLQSAPPSQAMIMMIVMYEDIGSMLDMEIEHTVLAAKIPTAGLESSAFQDRLLNKLLDLRMLKSLVEHTENRAELADESRKDIVEYCAGTDDTPGTDDDMRADLLDSGYTAAEVADIDEQMVFARNASWIPKLEKMFRQDKVFVAVGADHLSGPRGVVALLEKRGFKLTRVTR